MPSARRPLTVAGLAGFLALGLLAPRSDVHLDGRVLSPDGRPAEGAVVVATHLERRIRYASATDAAGRYRLAGLHPGVYGIEARHRASAAARRDSLAVRGATTLALRLPAGSPELDAASDAWLGLLPDGEAKRRFILDCTGCHRFDASRALSAGAARDEARWADDAARMLRFAGASSGFPVIAADRDPAGTAAWLVRHLGPDPSPRPQPGTVPFGRGQVTEFPFPEPGDLPHDVAVDRAGRVVITGMFSHAMFVLDPAAGSYERVAIPVPQANPRAVELNERDDWFVLLGNPKTLAVRDAATGAWSTLGLGLYAHSLGIGAAGEVWFNGHFTRDPEEIGVADLAARAVRRITVPLHPTLGTVPGGPMPYELRLGPDGRVWMSELQGNRIVGYDPASGAFSVHEMPTPASGPRRFDLDREGALWIPAYAANLLVRLDPRSGTFREIPLPIRDAAPYVARVDPASGAVWVGTAAADLLLRYEPGGDRWTAWPLPSRGALVRHLSIDPRTGEVWAAYGASPSRIPAAIARIAPQRE